METINLKKLKEVERKEQYRVEISYRFRALDNLDAGVDINNAKEVNEETKISAKEGLVYYELEEHAS
jgi:hypothetical protein